MQQRVSSLPHTTDYIERMVLQCATQIVVDASLAAKIVHKRIASPCFFRDILEELLNVSQISTIVRRRLLDEPPPALGVQEPGISENLEVFILGLYSHNRPIEEAIDCFSCSVDR